MAYALSNIIWCLSYFDAKKEYRAELVEALIKLIEPTRAEPGCLEYELVVDNENPNFLIMIEKFVSLEALNEHEQKSYIKNFVDNEMVKYCDKVTWHVGKEVSSHCAAN